jgi:hypothetical protein
MKQNNPAILTARQANHLNDTYKVAADSLAELVILSKQHSHLGAHAKQRLQTLADYLSAEHAANVTSLAVAKLLYASPSKVN